MADVVDGSEKNGGQVASAREANPLKTREKNANMGQLPRKVRSATRAIDEPAQTNPRDNEKDRDERTRPHYHRLS